MIEKRWKKNNEKFCLIIPKSEFSAADATVQVILVALFSEFADRFESHVFKYIK